MAIEPNKNLADDHPAKARSDGTRIDVDAVRRQDVFR
jgi:hypothetical protein